MKWSYPVGSILGTQLRIHLTFLLLLGYLAWDEHHKGSSWVDAGYAVLLVCLFFSCVVLHEFGHILAARRFGILTPSITLLPIGGVAWLEHLPKPPLQEIIVTVAGPLVNLGIAAVLTFWMDADQRWQWLWQDELGLLRTGNLVLFCFNLLPIFPMDGGRLVRAAIHWWTGDYLTATQRAARLGQACAILVPLCLHLAGVDFSPMLYALAAFLIVLGGAELGHVQRQATEEAQG
jgi:Zn-dependent protease